MTRSAPAISTRTTDFPGNRAARRAWLDAKGLAESDWRGGPFGEDQNAPTATVAKPTGGHPDGLRWTDLAAIWSPGRTRIWRARAVSADGERIDGADKPADELRLRHRSPADHPLWCSAIAQNSDAGADQ